MGYFLTEKIDFAQHNAEVRELMAHFRVQTHARVPVKIGGSIRNLISNPLLNTTGYSFPDFFTSAQAQINCRLEYEYYVRHHLLCDQEMGLPESWKLSLDFQNSYDQAWFGCPFRFFGPTDVPDTVEILKENPRLLYDWDDLNPFWGRGDFMERAVEIFYQMQKICAAGLEFHGVPVLPPDHFPGENTDGIFTVALKLRGASETMIDMYENPVYYHDLMDFITQNLIRRITAHRDWARKNGAEDSGESQPGDFNYADDSIAMLSRAQFREFVYPYQKRLFAEFSDGSGCNIHLCGDATHHFKFLADEFNVRAFDTGFPVDHGALRRELGPDIQINGGPSVMLLKNGTPTEIAAETKAICDSGVMDGKRFVLIAANNLAPCTPVENILAFYAAGKKFGYYS
jgi:hypothetical protein